MNSPRLKSLTLKGPNVAEAEVTFASGLNVIVGASDTGKTYIVECLDYMLGAGKSPKEIPEARPYDRILLEIASGRGETFTIERSLRDQKHVKLLRDGKEEILRAAHYPGRKDTLSYLLLSLHGLEGKKVLTHKRGKTRELSFRDIARLILVDETAIIAARSPIFSGQNQKVTVEKSVFRFVLTGVDDSSVIAREEPKIAKARRAGQSQIVDEMLERLTSELRDSALERGEEELREEFDSVTQAIEAHSKQMAIERESVMKLETKRKGVWTELRKVDSRLGVLAELQTRFDLLLTQYRSDLNRLESISEASVRLAQLPQDRCSVCGAEPKHQKVCHSEEQLSPESVAESCTAEASKIRSLIEDLQETIAANNTEVTSLSSSKDSLASDLGAAGTALQEELTPRMNSVLSALRQAEERKAELEKTLELFARKQELEELKRGVEKSASKKEDQESGGSAVSVGADLAEEFSLEVEDLLKTWSFPNLDRVTFSEADQDVVISGQKRASHGKGVRAITHAAFNLGLLQYCKTVGLAYPMFVILDSPLIVYRQPDAEEKDFSEDVKEGFYRGIAKDFSSSQVIVMENDPPPGDLNKEINLIEFSGTERGRQGFIPK